MRHYLKPDGSPATAEEALDAGALRPGYSLRSGLLTADAAPPAGDRMTIADLATLAEIPKTIPGPIAQTLQPIAADLAQVGNRQGAQDLMHRLEVEHTRLATKLESEKDAMRMGAFAATGNAAEIEAGWAGIEAALAWIGTVWATLDGALNAFRDAAPDPWKGVVGVRTPTADAGAAATGWDRALASAGMARPTA